MDSMALQADSVVRLRFGGIAFIFIQHEHITNGSRRSQIYMTYIAGFFEKAACRTYIRL